VDLKFEVVKPSALSTPCFQSSLDPSTLLPKYEMKVYIEDIFGSVGDNDLDEEEQFACERLEHDTWRESLSYGRNRISSFRYNEM